MHWSGNFAYAIGLFTTDGNLSKDGRHIDLTSKDLEQIQNFKKILKLKNKIGTKSSGRKDDVVYFRIQFGDVRLYRFLISIGLHPNKSKTLKKILIPNRYFRDFLRGHLDGDGFSYSYWDKRWKSSFMLYTGFISASRTHLEWIKDSINSQYKLQGRIKYSGKSVYHLMYAKTSSILLLNEIYHSNRIIYLQDLRTLTT